MSSCQLETHNPHNIPGKIYERPWGQYVTLEIGAGYQAKSIVVKPGGRLSLQSHFRRSEHWVVVQGEATVTINTTVKVYSAGEYAYIPLEAKHRLENHTTQPLRIIEVQIGDYVGEDDIVRYDDIYQRK